MSFLGDIGDAFSDGWDAVKGVAGDVIDGVGDVIDAVGDVATDIYEAFKSAAEAAFEFAGDFISDPCLLYTSDAADE